MRFRLLVAVSLLGLSLAVPTVATAKENVRVSAVADPKVPAPETEFDDPFAPKTRFKLRGLIPDRRYRIQMELVSARPDDECLGGTFSLYAKAPGKRMSILLPDGDYTIFSSELCKGRWEGEVHRTTRSGFDTVAEFIYSHPSRRIVMR